MGKLIAVLSGKGGVGKTTVSGGLACSLADMGHSVLLIDGDFELGNIDLTLGLSPPVQGLLDVLSGNIEAASAAVRPWVNRNLWFMELAVSPFDREVADLAGLAPLLRSTAKDYDYVIVDCPAGVGSYFKLIASACDTAIIVTTPDITAIRDAERCSYLLPKSCKSMLIVNRVRPKHIKDGTSPDIDFIIDRVGARLIGVLADDDMVTPLQNAGRPIVAERQCLAGRNLKDIARRIEGRDIPITSYW